MVGPLCIQGKVGNCLREFSCPPPPRNSVARVSKFCTCRCHVFTPPATPQSVGRDARIPVTFYFYSIARWWNFASNPMGSIVSRFLWHFENSLFRVFFRVWRDTRFISTPSRLKRHRSEDILSFSVIEEENVAESRGEQREENIESLLNDEPGKKNGRGKYFDAIF